MSHLGAGLTWLADPLHWTGTGGLLDRLREHLMISGWAVLLACAIGWPLGIWLGRRGRGAGVAGSLALPLLALIAVLSLGSGPLVAVVAPAVFALPPLITHACVGLRRIDPEAREAAAGMGLSGAQMLLRVELPPAAPQLVAGLRSAAVRVILAVTLVAFVDGGGLGQTVAAGMRAGDSGQIVAGGIAVTLLALLVEGVLAALRWAITPRALRGARSAAAAPAR